MSKEREYRVISPLDLDGKRKAIGATVHLTEEVAKDLLGHTVVLASEQIKPNQVSQAVVAVEGRAEELEQLRQDLMVQNAHLVKALTQLTTDRTAMLGEQEALALAQAELKTAQDKLAADRAEFDAKAAAAKPADKKK